MLFSVQFTVRENAIQIFHYHFAGHCGASWGLKWRILRAKLYNSYLAQNIPMKSES